MSTKRCNALSRICASLMLLQMIPAQMVLAQNASGSSNNTTGLPTSGGSDSWPWMQTNPDAVKHKDAGSNSAESSSASSSSVSAASSSPSSAGSSSPSPQASTASATPATPASSSSGVPESVSGSTSTQEKNKAKSEGEFKLESEHAKPAEARHDELKRESTAVLQQERPTTTVQPKSHMLFGRIEQLTSGVGAKFPVLKAQTAKMDLSGQTTLKAAATDNMFSGQIVRSFPSDFNGTWGGVLQLQQVNFDPLYYQVDPAEAKQTAELMRPGLQGKVNMIIQNTGSGLTLEPAKIYFSAPMTESRMNSQLSQLGSGGMTLPGMGNMASNPGMAQMMKSMMMSVPYIWFMSLGATQGTGLSGNAVQTNLVKNDVRQLSPTVIEQQIISQEHDTNPKTGKSRSSFSESVVRFTRYNASQQYVQAVAVDYSADKRFLRKMAFAGYVTKGAVQQMPDPMGGMGGLAGLGGAGGAGGAGGLPGLGGLGDLQKLFGGGGGGGMPGGMPGGVPNGFDPNALKKMFGQ
jgi:hypothetical protein